jgi:hypothetical protein
MPSEDPPENDDGRGHPTSLRRALIFVLLGPVLGILVAFYLAGEGHRDLYGVPIAYFFSLVVCAITGPVDGVLAYVAPIWLRAPLTAIAGAAAAVGLCFFLEILLGSKVTPSLRTLIPIAVIGASSTGACSLLTYFFRRRKV